MFGFSHDNCDILDNLVSIILYPPSLCMDNVSLAILLCMAGLRGTALSRLPSGCITHHQRYYPAIRLPVLRLPFFISCQAYHRLRCLWSIRGSPQLMRCLCATWLTSDPVVMRYVLPKRQLHVAFRPLNSVSAPGYYLFRGCNAL